MAKRGRKKKTTLYGVIEGDREEYFLTALIELYKPRENNIVPNIDPSRGGDPKKIVTDVLKCADRQRCFAWFDEDFEPNTPLPEDVRILLANAWCIPEEQINDFLACPLKDLQATFNEDNRKKPTLIVSNPVCVESIVLHALGRTAPVREYIHDERDNQINSLKGTLQSLIDNSGLGEVEFYLSELSIAMLESRKLDSPELAMLISMLTK